MKNEKEKSVFILEDLNNKMMEVISLGYDPIFISLRGSQNYELDIYTKEYQSDIDAVCFILPKLEDVILNQKMVSHTHVMKDNSHIDIKDIRLIIDLFNKSNISFLETLFTKYYICKTEYRSFFNSLKNRADEIALIDVDRLLKTTKGVYLNKKAALYKILPSQQEVVEEYGYAPKQLHHLVRLTLFLQDYLSKDFASALVPDENRKEELIKLKTEILSLEEVKKLEDESDVEFNKMYDYASSIEHEKNEDILNYIKKCVTDFIIETFRDTLSTKTDGAR